MLTITRRCNHLHILHPARDGFDFLHLTTESVSTQRGVDLAVMTSRTDPYVTCFPRGDNRMAKCADADIPKRSIHRELEEMMVRYS